MLAAGVISFGVGIAVASLFNQHNSGWHSWDMRWDDRRQPVVYRDAPYVSHSTTVVNRVTNINQYNNVNNVNRSIHTVNNYNNTTAAPTPYFNPPTPNAQPRVAPAAACADPPADLCAHPAGSGRAPRATVGQRAPCATTEEHADVHAYRAGGAPRAGADGRACCAGASIRRAPPGSDSATRRSARGARTGRNAASGVSAPGTGAASAHHAASCPGAADPPAVRSANAASPSAGAGETAGTPPDRRAAQGGMNLQDVAPAKRPGRGEWR